MAAPSKGISQAKAIFLLSSMAGWLIVGASLIYLVPAAADTFRPSDLTATWIETLGRSGYNPKMAVIGGGVALVLTVAGNALWYQKLQDKFQSKA